MDQNFPKAFQDLLRNKLDKIVDIDYIEKESSNLYHSDTHVIYEVNTKNIIGKNIRILGRKTPHLLVDISKYDLVIVDKLQVRVRQTNKSDLDVDTTLQIVDKWLKSVNARISKHKTLLKDQHSNSPLEEFIHRLDQSKNEYSNGDEEYFTDEQQKQIVNKLDHLETQLIEQCNPTTQQKDLIKKKKKRLISFLPKLTKKEWWMVCLNNFALIIKGLQELSEVVKPLLNEFIKIGFPDHLPDIIGILPMA